MALLRSLRAQPVLIAVDAAFALCWAVVYTGLATTTKSAAGLPMRPLPWWLAAALVAAVCAPIAVRRVWPVPALAVTLAGCCASTLLGVEREPYLSCVAVLYLVALRVSLRAAFATFGLTVLAAAVAVFSAEAIGRPPNGPGGSPQVLFFLASAFCASTAIGALVRMRRAHAAQDAAEHTRQAVTDERLRIARELHDVVAHSLSLIAVKAAVADHLAKDRPQETSEALGVIATTSRTALTEMRRVLGVLRADGASAELAPAPDLAELDHLVDYAGQAGVRVALDVCGAGQVPAAAALSAYRIVCESVTNVVRHAAPCACRVRVQGSADEVTVEVTDDGPGPAAVGGGHGLLGMRERVSVFGGEFSAGRGEGHGFRVYARLPCGSDDG